MPLSCLRIPFRALGAENELQIYAAGENDAHSAAQLAIKEVLRVEKTFSRYDDSSVVSLINRSTGGDPLAVDEETRKLLDYAGACYSQSDGLFDITSGVLRRAWNFRGGTLPSREQVADLLGLIGWNKVDWRPPLFRLPCAGMEIDFGGFGKEYAADRAAEVLRISGVDSALVNLAGDIKIVGARPDNTPWVVGLSHPADPKTPFKRIKISSGALATSGNYQRFIDAGGKRYCHILNPRTGWPPVDSFQSVTVLAPSALVAGTLATTAMLFGERDGIDMLREAGVSFVCMLNSGEVVQS